MTEKKSIRQLILEDILAAYRAAAPPLSGPVTDADYPYKYSTVELGSLTNADFKKHYAIGIVQGTEAKTDLYPLRSCSFTVHIEFHVTCQTGEVPGLRAEQVLTQTQRVMDNLGNFGGLIIMSREVGNEIDITSYSDKSVNGVVSYVIQYRHATADVRDPNPTV